MITLEKMRARYYLRALTKRFPMTAVSDRIKSLVEEKDGILNPG